jgi:hypothetical protein
MFIVPVQLKGLLSSQIKSSGFTIFKIEPAGVSTPRVILNSIIDDTPFYGLELCTYTYAKSDGPTDKVNFPGKRYSVPRYLSYTVI